MHIYRKQVDSQLCQQDHIYETYCMEAIHTFMNNSSINPACDFQLVYSFHKYSYIAILEKCFHWSLAYF